MKQILKILVPIIILVALLIMWYAKQTEKNVSLENSESVAEQKESVFLPPYLKDADFGLNLTEAMDFEKMKQYKLPIIVDYGADSCIPCKEMAPVLKKVNAEMYGKAFIKFGDVWKNRRIADNVPVQIIPTQFFINADGSPFVPSKELSEQIEFILYARNETQEHAFTAHQGGLTEAEMKMILSEMGVR